MYFAFDRLAAVLQSTRDETALVVCIVVLALAAERWLTRASLPDCAHAGSVLRRRAR